MASGVLAAGKTAFGTGWLNSARPALARRYAIMPRRLQVQKQQFQFRVTEH
jgi:hypothetical protein